MVLRALEENLSHELKVMTAESYFVQGRFIGKNYVFLYMLYCFHSTSTLCYNFHSKSVLDPGINFKTYFPLIGSIVITLVFGLLNGLSVNSLQINGGVLPQVY